MPVEKCVQATGHKAQGMQDCVLLFLYMDFFHGIGGGMAASLHNSAPSGFEAVFTYG